MHVLSYAHEYGYSTIRPGILGWDDMVVSTDVNGGGQPIFILLLFCSPHDFHHRPYMSMSSSLFIHVLAYVYTPQYTTVALRKVKFTNKVGWPGKQVTSL